MINRYNIILFVLAYLLFFAGYFYGKWRESILKLEEKHFDEFGLPISDTSTPMPFVKEPKSEDEIEEARQESEYLKSMEYMYGKHTE